MKLLLLTILAAACTACVSPQRAGSYPHGFITGDHMHYWNPKVARVIFGPPVKEPVSEDYAYADEDGNVHVSSKLRAKLK